MRSMLPRKNETSERTSSFHWFASSKFHCSDVSAAIHIGNTKKSSLPLFQIHCRLVQHGNEFATWLNCKTLRARLSREPVRAQRILRGSRRFFWGLSEREILPLVQLDTRCVFRTVAYYFLLVMVDVLPILRGLILELIWCESYAWIPTVLTPFRT